MGSQVSKPAVNSTATAPIRDIAGSDHSDGDNVGNINSVDDVGKGNINGNGTDAKSGGSGSGGGDDGCPMKLTDGSYSFDWKKIFALSTSKDGPSFPHGVKGSMPISPEQQEELKRQKKKTEELAVRAEEKNISGGCPIRGAKNDTNSACPVRGKDIGTNSVALDPTNLMPKVAAQYRAPDQKGVLSTERVHSTIDKGDKKDGETWVYPSAQMFYNALARKNKVDDSTEDQIDSIVALHNNMNEKTWQVICKWEEIINPSTSDNKQEKQLKLLKFLGRPMDLSPKAWIKHYIFGHPLPYDRHDWTVLRSDNTTVRYVIDYYHDESLDNTSDYKEMPELTDPDGTPSLLIDVRPALDYPSNLIDRVIRMPYAVHVQNLPSASNIYLPIMPTNRLRQQTEESVSVFTNIIGSATNDIQENAAGQLDIKQDENKFGDDDDEDENDGFDINELPEISEKEAILIATNFSNLLKECVDVQRKMNECSSEEECLRASMDLTMCMSKIICPIQHKNLTDSLINESNEEEIIEEAYDKVTSCILLQTNQHKVAKEKYPQYFD